MFWGKGEWAKYKEWLTRQAFVDHDLSPTAKNAFVVVLWHINQDTLGWALKVGTIATALGKSDQLPAMGYDYDDVKRHEFGRCNGWPKDHAGMRSRPSPDPYKEAEEAWKKTPVRPMGKRNNPISSAGRRKLASARRRKRSGMGKKG